MKIIGIIPARYASTRFPGKPLVMIDGKTMISRVIERARLSALLDDVVVATDDGRIADHVLSIGCKMVMTSSKHQSGTDRCFEAIEQLGGHYDAVINIQGDEPFVDPFQIDTLCNLVAMPSTQIVTLAKKIEEASVVFDPNKVKVVFGSDMRALYFSRSPIPHVKGKNQDEWLQCASYYKHIGLYGYKTETLRAIASLRPSMLEMAESLEQLRWMENGYKIHVAITEIETPAIDSPEDLANLQDHP